MNAVAAPAPDAPEGGSSRVAVLPPTRALLAPMLVFYVVAWFVELAAAIWLFSWSPLLAVLLTLTIGQHIWTQLGFFYHEVHHNQFFRSRGPNRFFYNLLSWMLGSNPQTYTIAHLSHHKSVHTYDDLEFWPRGKPATAAEARRTFLMQVLFGQIAWGLQIAPVIHAHPRHSWRTTFLFVGTFVGSHLALAYATHQVLGAWYYFAAAYMLHLWAFAVSSRYLQFAEHLGILAPEEDLHGRILLTRNVTPRGVLATLWHHLTVNDSLNHTDHHTEPRIPNRAVLPQTQVRRALDDELRVIEITELPAIFRGYWGDPLCEDEGPHR